ncbi:right-handed parallel beta-helix repeat-containing protein [Ruegeria sediminis]|uniref:right-handed parallel beta-helix repeat-containing protein n=1 Tax=Ruegeria sediminis TaxID=2583820 RepID=UPI001C5568AB|nr:right-handed parallel beta-helix repeat-containing protein [Ruegeria sediminis]
MSTQLSAAPACSGNKITTTAAGAGQGQVIRNAAELSAALRKARGGETLALAGGNYGTLKIRATFGKSVTIRSANPKSPACFSKLHLSGVRNIVLDGLVFDYAFTQGDKDSFSPFIIKASSDVTIANSVFDGDYNAGVGHGRGLRITDSASVSILNSTFRKWWKAITGGNTSNLILRGNNIYDVRSDGMAFGGISGLVVEANRLHNFRGVQGRDHRDMLQIMRSSGLRSTDVVIRDNIFDIGRGDYTQTIFMGSSGKNMNDPNMRHQNVAIENNVIYNAHVHGISVDGVDNLSIRRNTIIRVRRAEGGNVSIPRINVLSSKYVVIEKNVVSSIGGFENQRDWVVIENAFVQDESPSAQGYYDREFIYYATGPKNGYFEYGVRPGGRIHRLDAGSTLVRNYPSSRR